MQRKSQVKRKKRPQVLLRLAISKASNNESVKREKEVYIMSRRLQGQAFILFQCGARENNFHKNSISCWERAKQKV